MWLDIVFYIVLLGQVVLISFYYPQKLLNRSIHILDTCPPAQYPKLYENDFYANPETMLRKVLNRYRFVAFGIGLLGVSLLTAMPITGYAPHQIKENQHLIFVLFFTVLQMVPYIYIELSTYNWYKHVRAAFSNKKRTAELVPRRFFNFASPVLVALTIALFVSALAIYIIIHSNINPWKWNQYVTVFGISAMNVVFAVVVFLSINGKKLDPHQSHADQMRRIRTIVQIHLFSSIGMSLFLITMELVNQFRLDMFEPLFLSAYFQLIIVFGIGQMMRAFSTETVDFDAYKAEAS
ncbi:hypothetical protein [Maritalea sp.]|uniref:hypothetical protein n=1 Tax=Maritalea sp. TaxID=2003361 RepID=UPI003EF5CC8B